MLENCTSRKLLRGDFYMCGFSALIMPLTSWAFTSMHLLRIRISTISDNDTYCGTNWGSYYIDYLSATCSISWGTSIALLHSCKAQWVLRTRRLPSTRIQMSWLLCLRRISWSFSMAGPDGGGNTPLLELSTQVNN